MSNLRRGRLARFAGAGLVALAVAAGAGCAAKASGEQTLADPSTEPTTTATPVEPSPTNPTDPAPPKAPNPPPAPAAPSWPTPEDCISYNPANLTVQYAAGIYSVNDGSKVVARLHGGPGENVGEQGLALAKKYRKHCFLGRDNTREDKYAYIFDYWRTSSGISTTIPDEEDACSQYDRTNLTVEDMGGGYGWRVKDHDHVLHVFDNESDARNGKLVLAKYHQICNLGHSDDQDDISYSR